MSLTLHSDANMQNVLSPAGMAGANDLFDLVLEPLVALDDDDDDANVRTHFLVDRPAHSHNMSTFR